MGTNTNTNPNSDPDTMFKMLQDLLSQGIKPVIDVQWQTFEKIVTPKLLTTLNTKALN